MYKLKNEIMNSRITLYAHIYTQIFYMSTYAYMSVNIYTYIIKISIIKM